MIYRFKRRDSKLTINIWGGNKATAVKFIIPYVSWRENSFD
jgi:hypothetical protein